MIIAKRGATLESHNIVQDSMALEVKDLNIYENASIKAINEINEGRDSSSKINVEFVDENSKFNGKYNRENNTIYLSKNTTKALRQVLTHEISHAMENNAEYNDILQEMVDNLVEDEDFNKIKEKVREDYKDQNLSEAGINNESITEYIADNFFKSYSDLSKAFTNKTTLEKFKDMIRGFRSGSKNNSLRDQYLKLFQKLNNTNVVQNTNKKIDKSLRKVYDKDAKRRAKEEKKYYHLNVAPLNNTSVNEENFDEINSQVEEPFMQNVDRVSKKMGLDVAIEKTSINVGGFLHTEGQYAGQFVNELSYTLKIPISADANEVKTFAMLMGDLGYEVQDGVILTKYIKNWNSKDSGIEYRVYVKDIIGIQDLLKELFKESGYTLNIDGKFIQLFFDKKNIDKNITKIYELLNKLGGNYNGFEEKAIHSEYYSKQDRRNTYETRLATTKEGDRDWVYRDLYSEALEKIEKSNRNGIDLKKKQEEVNKKDKFSLKSKNDIKETREFAKQTIDKFNIMVDGTGVSFVDTKGSLDKLLLKLVNNTSKVEDVRKKRSYRFLINHLIGSIRINGELLIDYYKNNILTKIEQFTFKDFFELKRIMVNEVFCDGLFGKHEKIDNWNEISIEEKTEYLLKELTNKILFIVKDLEKSSILDRMFFSNFKYKYIYNLSKFKKNQQKAIRALLNDSDIPKSVSVNYRLYKRKAKKLIQYCVYNISYQIF